MNINYRPLLHTSVFFFSFLAFKAHSMDIPNPLTKDSLYSLNEYSIIDSKTIKAAMISYNNDALTKNEKIQTQLASIYSINSFEHFYHISDDSGFINMNELISEKSFKRDVVYQNGFFNYYYDKAFDNYAAYLKICKEYPR